MMEPSEDSFETMMERRNPSSKQMESSEGSSDAAAETAGSQAQAGPQDPQQPPSDPLQEMEVLPTDVRQAMEEPSSGPCHEIGNPPNDLLQDLEESHVCLVVDPEHAAPAGVEEGPRARRGEVRCTDLIPFLVVRFPEDREVDAIVRCIVSLYFRLQTPRERRRMMESAWMTGLRQGRDPFPAPFTGDRREYREFVVICQLILRSYPGVFSDDQTRIGYIVSRLSGMALDWAKCLLWGDSPVVLDFPGFLEAMSGTFEHRPVLRLAEEAMFAIRQQDRPAIAYIHEFQGLVPILGWPEEVLQAHLCQGLNEDIRHYLFRVPQPDTLESLIAVILQIEEKLAERRALLRLPPGPRPRSLAWIDSPASQSWTVSSWLSGEVHPNINRAHIFLLLLVRVNPYHSVAVQALVDSGAGGNFMDEKFAQEHYVELYQRPYPRSVQTVDGSLIGNEPMWLYTEPLLCIHQNHHESIVFDVVPSPTFSIILGIDWLRVHSPEVDWLEGRCAFHSPYCLSNCLRPPPPCIALERLGLSLLPGLPPPYSDLADVFNPYEADEETSDQPSSDGSDDLSESEPSELQQAGDSDLDDEVFFEYPAATTPWDLEDTEMPERAGSPQEQLGDPLDVLTGGEDDVQVIPELFDQLHGAAWFTKLDLRGTIVEESTRTHQAEDVWRMAFGLDPPPTTCYRPFVLFSDPILPQNVIHFALQNMLGLFVLAYGRDVIVYSMSPEQHTQHVRQVLVRLREHQLYCSLDKSQFHQQTVEFLGFVLTPKGIKLNKSVVNTVTGYPLPGCRKALRSLLEFILPYRHFVERFAVIIGPLRRQLLGDESFSWGAEEQEAFESLQRAFRKAPLLHHPKPQHPFYLEADNTGNALHASLMQIDEQTGRVVPCAFYSRNTTPAEQTQYPPLQQKVLPVWASFMVWRRYLENTEEPIMILLKDEDHASLNNDRLTVLLPGRWLGFFSHFHFDVMEQPPHEGDWPPPPQGNLDLEALRQVTDPRKRFILATGGTPPGAARKGPRDAPRGPDAELEKLAHLPIHRLVNCFLSHFSPAQVREAVTAFSQGLVMWRHSLALATIFLLLRLRRRLTLMPALESGHPWADWPLSLGQDAPWFGPNTLFVAKSDLTQAIGQLLDQVPSPEAAGASPAAEAAAFLLSPERWERDAQLPQARGGLLLSPEFWPTLHQLLAPGDETHPALQAPGSLAAHVVGGGGFATREALQDDLQRYRHRGLHDGLQDTPQDEQDDHDDHVPGGPPAGAARALLPRRRHPHVLAVIDDRLLYIHAAPGSQLHEGLEAATLAHFLRVLRAQEPHSLIWVLQPGQGPEDARPREPPRHDDGDVDLD